jgi:hypothetical protein
VLPPLGESLLGVELEGEVEELGVVDEEEEEGVDVEPPIELDPLEPKLLVLDDGLLKLLVLLYPP